MKTGILTSGVNQDLERALKIIQDDGFSYVEIQYAWGMEDGSRSEQQEQKVFRLLKKYHIQCTAVMRNIFSSLSLNETGISDPNYQRELAHLRASIHLAKSYGCNITRINSFDRHHVIFGYGGAENYLSDHNRIWSNFLHLMEPVCEIAEEEKITVMIETGTKSFLHTAALMRKALDELKCSWIKALWDPANCLYSFERPYPDGYEILGDKIAEIHMKDLNMKKEFASVTYCPLGEGMMAPYLNDIASALHRDQFQGGVILENQVTPEGGTEEDGYRLSVPVFQKIFMGDNNKERRNPYGREYTESGCC